MSTGGQSQVSHLSRVVDIVVELLCLDAPDTRNTLVDSDHCARLHGEHSAAADWSPGVAARFTVVLSSWIRVRTLPAQHHMLATFITQLPNIVNNAIYYMDAALYMIMRLIEGDGLLLAN